MEESIISNLKFKALIVMIIATLILAGNSFFKNVNAS